MIMKKNSFLRGITVLLCFLPCLLSAQQIPISIGQVLGYQPYHPGYFPQDDFNQLSASYQQNDAQINSWSASSQFLQFASRPQGGNKTFSWGLLISNDKVHTEQRFSFAPSIAAQVFESTVSSLSVGISLGFLNWYSNYHEVYILDGGDEVIRPRNNFLEVDAG